MHSGGGGRRAADYKVQSLTLSLETQRARAAPPAALRCLRTSSRPPPSPPLRLPQGDEAYMAFWKNFGRYLKVPARSMIARA